MDPHAFVQKGIKLNTLIDDGGDVIYGFGVISKLI